MGATVNTWMNVFSEGGGEEGEKEEDGERKDMFAFFFKLPVFS